MSEPYATTPLTWTPAPRSPDEFARSDYWTILCREGEYILDYISGEHSGDARKLAITRTEAEKLRDGALSFDELLISHGAH